MMTANAVQSRSLHAFGSLWQLIELIMILLKESKLQILENLISLPSSQVFNGAMMSHFNREVAAV